MTKSEFKRYLEIYGELFYDDTCPKFQAEILRRILNCKFIDEFAKITMVNQYTKNLSVNRCILESIKEYSK